MVGVSSVVVLVLLAGSAADPIEDEDLLWWQKTIVYQIYPRSFQDSDGDGVGDIQGIISRLDHFLYLGVGALWLSPIYRSPMADFGYDISDHMDIDPIFGTLSDFADLITAAHYRGIKIIMDYVPNHTSIQHPWFRLSREGGEHSPYRDYYIWSKGKATIDGLKVPPNNWLSVFGGSAWTWDDVRQAFYYHHFLKDQPDLNYRNPAVSRQIEDVLRFWVERGVDGFRVDAIRTLFEVEDLSMDEPRSYLPGYTQNQSHYLKHLYTEHQPEIHVVTRRWREILEEYKRRTGKHIFLMMAISRESWDLEESMKYYYSGADMPMNTNLFDMTPARGARWFHHQVDRWMSAMPDRRWPSFVLSNHGQRRLATRKGSRYTDALNILLLTLPGTCTTYQGEEIGQQDIHVTFEDTKDPWGKLHGEVEYARFTRDPGRGPIQWNDSINAGFSSSAKTWLPVHPEYNKRNVAHQMSDTSGRSSIQIYRKAALLRREASFRNNRIQYGVVNDQVFSYVRSKHGHPAYLIAMNLGMNSSSDDYRTIQGLDATEGDIVISAVTRNTSLTEGSRASLRNITLQPGEAIIARLHVDHTDKRLLLDEL